MNVVPRSRWGARFAAGFGPAPAASELYLHHSVTRSAGEDATEAEDAAGVRQLEGIGQARFGGGISYTFVACASGRVFEGTGPLRVGAHTKGRNTRARAIVLLGDHSRVRPTEQQLDAVAALVRHGHAVGWWACDRLTGGHRDAPGAQTECPGAAAYSCIPVINSRATTVHLQDLEDDMTPEDRQRLARLEQGVTTILQQLAGPGATLDQPWPGVARGGGWEHWRYNHPAPERLTLVDLVRSIDRQVNSGLDLANRPAGGLDDAFGHGLSTRAELAEVRQALARIEAWLAGQHTT